MDFSSGKMSGFFSSFFGRDCADIEVDPNADPFDKSEISLCVAMLREKPCSLANVLSI